MQSHKISILHICSIHAFYSSALLRQKLIAHRIEVEDHHCEQVHQTAPPTITMTRIDGELRQNGVASENGINGQLEEDIINIANAYDTMCVV